jgi:hypothetical protein
MILKIEVSIRAWYPTGEAILPSALATNILNVDTERLHLVGAGEPWQSARIVLAETNLDSFGDAEEPHEAFQMDLNQSLKQASSWLSTVDYESLEKSRNDGLNIDIFVEAMVDNNQLEFRLPAEFLTQVSRLQLPIEVMSDS